MARSFSFAGRPIWWLALVVVMCVFQVSVSAASWWMPPPGVTWDYQLTDHDFSVKATLIDLDLFETTKAEIDQLHAKGKRAMCYFSAGSYENWRPDAKQFSTAVRGRALDGWAGEQWLNLNNYLNNGIGAIMKARLDQAKSKGCDCVEPDNVDGYTQNSGFKISYATQIAYNKFLATEAHNRGMCIALKNNLAQVKDLVSSFDLAVNEQCNVYGECAQLNPFKTAKKAVVGISYCEDGNNFALPSKVCPSMQSSGISWVIKKLDLPARPMFSCADYSTSKPAPNQATGICKLASSSRRRLRQVAAADDASLTVAVDEPQPELAVEEPVVTDPAALPVEVPVLGFDEDGVPIVDDSLLVVDPLTGEPMPYLEEQLAAIEEGDDVDRSGVVDENPEMPDTPPTEEDLIGGWEVWEGDEAGTEMEVHESADAEVPLVPETPSTEGLQETLDQHRRHLRSANDVDSGAAAPQAILAALFVASAFAFLL